MDFISNTSNTLMALRYLMRAERIHKKLTSRYQKTAVYLTEKYYAFHIFHLFE